MAAVTSLPPQLTNITSSNSQSSGSIPSTTGVTGTPFTATTSNTPLAQSKSGQSKLPSQFTFSLETPSLSSGTLDKYLKSVLGNESSSAIPDLLKPAADTVGVSQGNPSSTSSDVTKQPPQQPPLPLGEHREHLSTAHQEKRDLEPVLSENGSSNQQLATTESTNNEVIPIPRGQSYVDITEYLNMPQADAAKKLGIPPSTLSKRWKEAVRKRKWPYRMICKIDKEIMTLLHNVPQGPNAPPLPEEIETALGHLLRRRQDELRPVVIRI